MEENVQKEEGISLLELVRLLFSKIKLLILVVLISGIAGGMFAIWRTVDIDYYGTKVEFYVNPEKPTQSQVGGGNLGGGLGGSLNGGITAGGSQYGVYGAYGRHVMDNMIKLLSSESFAERLMLLDNGLPAKGVWATEADDERAGEPLLLDDKIDVAVGLLEKTEQAQSVAVSANDSLAVALEAEAKALTALNKAWKKAGYTGSFDEEEFIPEEVPALDEAYEVYKQAVAKTENATAIAAEAEAAVHAATEISDAAKETALDAWRQTSKYSANLARIMSATNYSYLEDSADIEDANNLARSFIYVHVSVLNDQEFASSLLQVLKREVPRYVEENMAIPDGYSGTNCQRITRTDNIHLTNGGYTTSQAIKYGVLFAAAALVVACVIIIIVDRSDKRLRDYEIITRNFNIPVLGVVPTIEEMEMASAAKKNSHAKANKEAKK